MIKLSIWFSQKFELEDYQIENLLYTRENKDQQEWSEWRNHSMKAELVEKDLYLSDQ